MDDLEYRTELQLVQEFVKALNASPWGDLSIAQEFDYGRGRTDVIAAGEGGRVLAFEAKLSRWRCAMQQAYRNTCFAHESYVVLPCRTAKLAAHYSAEFSRRGVGICTVRSGQVIVLQEARPTQPLQGWLSDAAVSQVRARNEQPDYANC